MSALQQFDFEHSKQGILCRMAANILQNRRDDGLSPASSSWPCGGGIVLGRVPCCPGPARTTAWPGSSVNGPDSLSSDAPLLAYQPMHVTCHTWMLAEHALLRRTASGSPWCWRPCQA